MPVSDSGQGWGVLGVGSLNPISSVIQFCCSSRLAVVQARCSEDDPASLVYLPLCCSSEGSLGLTLARLLMEGFLWLDVLSQSVRAHCALPTLNLLCVVMWGEWMTS